MKNFTLLLTIITIANVAFAQPFIGVSATHKILTPAVKSSSPICPSGSEQTTSDNEIYEKQLIELINIERDQLGLAPLKQVDALTKSARYHSKDMADQDYFSHNSISGCTTFDRIIAFYSYLSAGENIATGFSSASSVHSGFMNSPPHYATMTNSSYREVGVGYSYNAQASGNTRWVENFGSRLNVYPIIINLEAISTESADVTIYAHGKDNFSEIRFKNDGGSWSNWMTFDKSEFDWSLSGSSGVKTVIAEMKTGSTTKTSQDDIDYSGGPTSIDEVATEELKIVPNPVIDVFKVYNIYKYTHYRVVNMQGQEMQNGDMNSSEGAPAVINVENLPKGMYMIIITNDYETLNEVFVKL